MSNLIKGKLRVYTTDDEEYKAQLAEFKKEAEIAELTGKEFNEMPPMPKEDFKFVDVTLYKQQLIEDGLAYYFVHTTKTNDKIITLSFSKADYVIVLQYDPKICEELDKIRD